MKPSLKQRSSEMRECEETILMLDTVKNESAATIGPLRMLQRVKPESPTEGIVSNILK